MIKNLNHDSTAVAAWRRPAWAVAIALTALLTGCSDQSDPLGSSSFYPVKGKVTLPDGKPLAAVNVVFAGPATSTATTGSDGTFTVKGTKDGLPEGDYKVRLEVLEIEGDDQETGRCRSPASTWMRIHPT